jgi:predicted enzyme related to lactoylglutathione lyase
MTNPNYFETTVRNPEGLAEFYRGVFGWRIEQIPGVESDFPAVNYALHIMSV